MTSLAIAPASEVGPGEVKSVQVKLGPAAEVLGPPLEQGPPGTTAIVVAHTRDDGWYAIGDVCSHGPVLLSEGEFEGCALECWGHGSRFDLATGEPENLPANQPVATYPVRIEDGQIVIELNSGELDPAQPNGSSAEPSADGAGQPDVGDGIGQPDRGHDSDGEH
jgi:nitrite reductase/ring-hydroxylating ferredoxin subunit